MNRIGLKSVTSIISLVLSLITTISSIGLAGFSLFGERYLRYADESLLNFVYSTGFISIIGVATAIVGVFFSIYILKSTRNKLSKNYILTETARTIEVTVPAANQRFTIDLNDPKSVAVRIQEIDKAINKAKP